MNQRKRLFAVGVIVATLSGLGSCRQTSIDPEPTPLDFDADPRVLRGVWVGENDHGETLRLVAKAGPPYGGGYEIVGSFELNGEAPIAFEGGVAVPVTQGTMDLSPSVSPTCGPVNAFAEFERWELCGEAPEGSPPQFDLWLSNQESAHTFTLTKLSETNELPPDEDAAITTDAVTYTPQVSGDAVSYTVQATYTNTTGASVYLVPCGYEPPIYGLQRFEAGAWHTTALGPPCHDVGGISDTELKPGESFAATLEVFGATTWPATPQFGVDLVPGVHRLLFVVTSTPREGDADDNTDDLLPLEQRVSNAFKLQAP